MAISAKSVHLFKYCINKNSGSVGLVETQAFILGRVILLCRMMGPGITMIKNKLRLFAPCEIFHSSIFLYFFSKKIFQEHHQSVKQFESRPGPTFCKAWSGTKLIAKVISRRHYEANS